MTLNETIAHDLLGPCAIQSAETLTKKCEQEIGQACPVLVLIATPARCVSAATLVDRDGLILLVKAYLEAIENDSESVRPAS